MEIIADLQLHSRHSRATSKDLSIDNLEKYARIKGLNLLGTGDFQHPEHRKEIDAKLKEDDKGILRTKKGFPFIWQTEISFMYSQNDKRRAVHLLVFAPNKTIADKITNYLASRGRIDYDGRPIFGINARDFVKDMKEIDDKIEIIPAHCLLPNEKIMCNPEQKSISDIEIGDKVLTHTGVYKKVIKNYSRDFNGKAYLIKPYYFREGLKVTNEHPFLAIKSIKNCQYVGGLCKPNSISKGKHECKAKHYESYKPEWITAENLEVNDILLYPRPKEIADTNNINILEIIGDAEYRLFEQFIVPKTGRQDNKINNIINITPEFCRLTGYYLAEGYIVKKANQIQFSFAF